MQFQPLKGQQNLPINGKLDKSRFGSNNEPAERVSNLGQFSFQGEKPKAKLSMRE
jgi:hypothetical protein